MGGAYQDIPDEDRSGENTFNEMFTDIPDEDIGIRTDTEEVRSFSQSDALERLVGMLKFAQEAGLDGPSARIALTESMRDEER